MHKNISTTKIDNKNFNDVKLYNAINLFQFSLIDGIN